MQEDTMNPVDVIRSVKRCDLKDLRDKNRELLLGHKRLRLHEVSEYMRDITLSEFKELLLKLKKKPVPLELVKKIKNSCISSEYIEAVFKNEGAFNLLVQILIGNDAQKQLEAAACLTNLSCGPHKCSYKVAKASGAYLVSFMNGNSYFLKDQSTWAVANIANDCFECFKIIKAQGVLPALHKALTLLDPNVLQSVVFALNACTKYEDPEVISLIQSDLPELLLLLLEQNNFNKNVFLDTALTLSNCCFFSVKHSLCIFDIKTAERILDILLKAIKNSEIDIMYATPVLRCIGFLSFDDKISDFLVSNTSFYEIIQIIALAKDYVHLIKETIWILSNVTVSSNVISNVENSMLLVNTLNNILKLEKSVTLQVLYYLSILASKNDEVCLHLKQHDIIIKVKSLLENEQKDIVQATEVILSAVELSNSN